jgi:hypothetical protein
LMGADPRLLDGHVEAVRKGEECFVDTVRNEKCSS